MIFPRLRRLLGIPTISEAEAVALAKAECDRLGWPWQTPIHVSDGLFVFNIRTNARNRGGNVNIHIGCRNGRVYKAGFARW